MVRYLVYCNFCDSYHHVNDLCVIKENEKTKDVRSILIENREQLNLYFMPCINNWIH